MDKLEIARNTIRIEAEALNDLLLSLDNRFLDCIESISVCKGRIVITGIGKSAIVAQKMVATLNSTGTHALFMHAADAVHGDLGMISSDDLVICISKSGETPELKVLIPILKSYKVEIVAMTSSLDSYLAQNANRILHTPVKLEADPNRLAPTTSTTVQSSMGDAVAIVLLSMKGFTSEHFAKFHPGGALGKRLYLKVSDLYKNNSKPQVNPSTSIKEILLNMSSHRLGATVVVDDDSNIAGIITDGDIRRWFQRNDQNGAFAQNIMTIEISVVEVNELAIAAFEIMKDKKITQLPVVENGKYVGMIHINDLLKEGLV